MTEDELQKKIANRLNSECLLDMIVRESIDNVSNENEVFAKKYYYDINAVLKTKYIEAANRVLEIIEGDLEVIIDDGHSNISMNAEDSLNPDLLLYSSEEDAYVIVELKVSANAERQAVTEVLAYQFEIRNYLPGLSNYNMPIIIISKEYRPLLLHSVASLLWNNQDVLCLRIVDEDKPCFEIVDCNIWTDIENELDETMLSGYSFCLYPRDKTVIGKDNMRKYLELGCNMIVQEAEATGGQGVAFAWEYRDADGIKPENGYYTDYVVSLYFVNPYSMYKYDETNLRKINKHINTTAQEMVHMAMGDKYYTQKFKQYFSKYFNVKMEGLGELADFLAESKMQDREIVYADSWGEFGKKVREIFLLNDFVKADEFSSYKNGSTFLKICSIIFDNYIKFEHQHDLFLYGAEQDYFTQYPFLCNTYRYYKYQLSEELLRIKYPILTDEENELIQMGKEIGFLLGEKNKEYLSTSGFVESGYGKICERGFATCLYCLNKHISRPEVNNIAMNLLISFVPSGMDDEIEELMMGKKCIEEYIETGLSAFYYSISCLMEDDTERMDFYIDNELDLFMLYVDIWKQQSDVIGDTADDIINSFLVAVYKENE